MQLRTKLGKTRQIDYFYDDEAWQDTVNGPDGPAPGAKKNLVIQMNRHDEDAWRPKERWFRVATFAAKANLANKERKCASREREGIVEC